MTTSKLTKPLIFLLLIHSASASLLAAASPDSNSETFFRCVSINSDLSLLPLSTKTTLFTPNHSSSFTSALLSTAQNLRFAAAPTQKPDFIFSPLHDSHVRASVICSKRIGIQLRFRSGGHDYEGLSYAPRFAGPFAIIDLANLRRVKVNAGAATAWVQSGATVGEVQYRIAQRSSLLAFPAGVCPSVGVGGHITGGAYGSLMRKYGLGADNVLDARMVDFSGAILDRAAMGEDLFWAIRGGGGQSFGVILWWKIKLVAVPERVTVFTVGRTLEQGATAVLRRWQQVADKLDRNLFLRVIIYNASLASGGGATVLTSYNALFLGGSDELLRVVGTGFPELGLKRKDCVEMSWVQSVVYMGGYPVGAPAEVLLEGKNLAKSYFKAKSDFVREPLPTTALEGLWERILDGRLTELLLTPYGGAMSDISETEIPFPHRSGRIFMVQYLSTCKDGEVDTWRRLLDGIREVYDFMGPYVSKSPREAYVNYRDLDLGVNDATGTSFEAARLWGEMYFNIDNFKRLVKVKAKFDPEDFFWHEQSIPHLAMPPPNTNMLSY